MQAATFQSIPQMSQAPPVAPSSYVVPAQLAPAPSYQAAPVPYQVGMSYPQAVPQAAPSYQSAPTPYAPQYQPADQSQSSSAGNPWESAFNKVVNLLSAPVQSPFQGQPSAPTPQYAPANYGQVSSPATQQSAPQTWQANPAYSPNYSQTSSSPSLEEIADYVWMSQESRQVMDAFGIEAPAVLNNYALNLEGMLDSAVAWGNQAANTIQGYAQF